MGDKVKFGIVCFGAVGGGVLCVVPVIMHFQLRTAIASWVIGTIMYFAAFFLGSYFVLQKPVKK